MLHRSVDTSKEGSATVGPNGAGKAACEWREGENQVPSRSRPVDLVHLARQTLGDSELEREVLSMFLRQALSVRERIGQVRAEERRLMAHGLVGAARGVGAFAVAECAREVEESPERTDVIGRLKTLIDDVHGFIGGMGR